MIVPTPAQTIAAQEAARKALSDYSGFYSRLVADDVLEIFVIKILSAALNAKD